MAKFNVGDEVYHSGRKYGKVVAIDLKRCSIIFNKLRATPYAVKFYDGYMTHYRAEELRRVPVISAERLIKDLTPREMYEMLLAMSDRLRGIDMFTSGEECEEAANFVRLQALDRPNKSELELGKVHGYNEAIKAFCKRTHISQEDAEAIWDILLNEGEIEEPEA